MADDESPRPFRRERNLSNRNFRRHGSNRRFSAESHSSIESYSNNNETDSNPNASSTPSTASALSASSSFLYSYSANSDEQAFKQTSLLKIQQGEELQLDRSDSMEVPPTPDPALMGFQQKLQRFETLKADERIIFKIGKFNSKQLSSGAQLASPLRVLPPVKSTPPGTPTTPTTPPSLPTSSPPLRTPEPRVSSLYNRVRDEHSEDEVDELSSDSAPQGDYELASEGHTKNFDDANGESALIVDDFGKVQPVSRNNSCEEDSEEGADATKKAIKDFPRNYRSTPRPKTEIIGTTNRHLIGKFNSLRHPKHNDEEEREEDEVELRDVSFKSIQPILDELITSEATYVESLFNGIKNYGNIFDRKDLPLGLRGKKYVLLGNIEQIAEFHRDEFLPMLVRNRRNLKQLFDEFQHFVEQNCFYGYVIFTMNKQKSLKLCDEFKNYFKELQVELNDKLGINSFLVQPIQRIAKYPLLLKEFISALFQNREIITKPLIESCCRLDKKIRTLLTTTNESEVVNDIIDCHEFNVFFQGKFRKVSDFSVFDHTLKRSYRGKLFIFDKCIIYTEIKGKHLVFHGRYPCEHIGIVSKTKSFTLFYQRRKQQECDFSGDVALVEMWMELIRDMVSSFATEERRKLQELYSRESDHMHRKPPSLSLFRDSNRFSSDSGIGNIWVMPKPEVGEDALSNRTTWYAVS